MLHAAAAIAAALLLSASQCWPPAALLCLVGFIPLLAVLRSGGLVRIWATLLLFGSIFTILSMWWIGQTGSGVGWVLAAAPLYAAIPLLLPAAGLAFARSPATRLIAFPFLWTATEILVRKILLQLNWAIAGLPLADIPFLAQVVSITGPEAASFLAAAFSAGSILLVMLSGRQRMYAAAAVVVGATLILAYDVVSYNRASGDSKSIRVGVVQPAIPQELAWTAETREAFLKRMSGLVDRAVADRAEMVVLPEGAVYGLVRYDNRLTDFVRSRVIETRTPLLFGSIDREGSSVWNVGIYIDPFNTVTTYRKVSLAPLVEYEPRLLPYRRPSSWLRYSAGQERTIFTTVHKARFTTLICLEDSQPELARDSAKAGAEFLVALVNTERYSGTALPLQHLRRARLNAIAAGLPMVRCANSGVSGLIDAQGRVLERLPENTPTAAVVDVNLAGAHGTPYVAIGDWPWVAMMLAAGFGVSWRSSKRG